ncbi:MAG: S8 family serine peptidase [Candidatus Thorarchaeota archaeon]
MKRALVVILLLVIPVIGMIPMIDLENETVIESSVEERLPLIEDTGEKISVSIRFDRELTCEDIHYYESLGVSFGVSPQHIGSIYIAEASETVLEYLSLDPNFITYEPLRQPKYMHQPRNVSVTGTETYSDIAWQVQDYYGTNLTGEGLLIADLDTGIQWRHPDFFFPDGGTFSWFDTVTGPPYLFVNGTDGIDLNTDFSISANETLYTIDTNKNGNYEVGIDWIWLDNGTNIGTIDDGDTFFVVNDANNDGQLSTGETLEALLTPKTKYIVHKPSTIQTWERGVNLTSCTYYDTNGHGTGVAGILNGGQLGYRQFVGVAPDAELMAINIFGSDGLTVEEGLIWARDHGADVILIEVGSWTYEFLDGSSNVELMIDGLTASGIPVIVPAGNLQGGMRHAHRLGVNNVVLSTDFRVPTGLGATEVYITILCDKLVDNIQLNITEPVPTGTAVHQVTFGSGYNMWLNTYTTNVTIAAFVANSTRGGNYMIAIDILGTIKDTSYWSVDIISPYSAGYNFYIADDASAWSGGSEWRGTHGVTDQFLITWPSTADTAISVASYMSRNLWSPGYGMLAPYSSIGPRVDNNPKMSVAAPGGWDIVSPWSNDSAWASWMTGVGGLPLYPMFGGYQLFSGTSAAGPHVAGAVALLLQLNPDCGMIVKDLIGASAYTDAYTPAISPPPGPAHPAWGYGKLNVSKAVEEAMKLPLIWNTQQSPTAPQYYETVTVTTNISNADFVSFEWTFDYWNNITTTNMTLSSGLYTTTIPAHAYGVTIDYRIMPVNTSAIGGPLTRGSYQVADTIAPVINSFTHNATSQVIDPSYIEVVVGASEPTNASGVANAVIEFSSDNFVTINTASMTFNGSHWVGYVPPNPPPMQVKFRVRVSDLAGNTAISSDFTYDSVFPTTTTTTTTTSTSTTTTGTSTTDTTTSTGTTTGPTGGITDFIQENLYIIIAVGVVLALILLVIICRRR